MKKIISFVTLLFCFLAMNNVGVVYADQKPQIKKPPHYGDWDVIYDKVLKKTTIIHQHRPYGEPTPGMGDAFTRDTFFLNYSLEAIITGTPGTPTFKIQYYWLFDNILVKNATLALAVSSRFFKYSTATQFTLLIDDDSSTVPGENYHTGEFGDDFIGHFPFEEVRAPLTQAQLDKMLVAKEIAGNLSSDDQNAGKSFSFDKTFKEILNAFVFHIEEVKNGTAEYKK